MAGYTRHYPNQAISNSQQYLTCAKPSSTLKSSQTVESFISSEIFWWVSVLCSAKNTTFPDAQQGQEQKKRAK